MKNTIFTIATFLFSISLMAQDRVNRAEISFQNTSLSTLDSATGWSYETISGKWINYQNMISSESYESTPSLKNTDYHRSHTMNFNNLKFKTYEYENQIYYVLIVNSISGAYEYPSIYKGYYTYKKIVAYVFTESEFKNLQSYQNATVLFSVGGSILYYPKGESDLLNEIHSKLLENKSYNFDIFKVVKTEDGNNVRFRLPEYKSYSDNFSKNYFEISISKFDEFVTFN